MGNVDFSLVLPEGFGLGGVTSWSLQISDYLSRHGFKTAIIDHVNKTDNQDSCILSKDVWHIPCKGPHPAFAFDSDVKKHYKGPYSKVAGSICIPNWSSGAYGACAQLAQSEDLYVIGVGHTDFDYYYELLEYYEPMIARFIAVSEDIAKTLKERLPHRAEHIYARPCSVDYAESYPEKEGSDQRPLVLTYAGRIEEDQKCIMSLVPYVEALQRKNIPFTMNIIGSGTFEDKLKEAIGKLSFAENESVNFLGRIPNAEMAQAWRDSDISILVSAFEGTSLSMLESMGQGCVPVVTEVSGTEKVISEGQNGFTSPVGDLEGLTDTIGLLHHDRGLFKACSQTAWETVKQGYGHDAYVEFLLPIAEEIKNEPVRRWPEDKPVMRETLPFIAQKIKWLLYKVQDLLHKCNVSVAAPNWLKLFLSQPGYCIKKCLIWGPVSWVKRCILRRPDQVLLKKNKK